MKRKNYNRGIKLKACIGLLEGMTDEGKLETMKAKAHEELAEFDDAVDEFQHVDNAAIECVRGKAREHALEEGIDAITAIYTRLRIFASHAEIQKEAAKVIIKNDLRGYTKEPDPSDEEIPF